MLRRTPLLLPVLAVLLVGCSVPFAGDSRAEQVAAPKLGACRDLSAADLKRASNDTDVVACSEDHTAQTFAVGPLPTGTGSAYRDKRHGRFVYTTCQQAFRDFLGADESLAMRVQLSWAWFRPSEAAWKQGARWYRCDLVGGPVGATKLHDLPEDGKGMFAESLPDRWLTCARGSTVASGTKVACSEKHDWRAVTTVKVGRPEDPYPGDRLVQVRSRDYCSESVGGWMHYPPDYDYGYSWFREAQWKAGNRRSVCWAKTAN